MTSKTRRRRTPSRRMQNWAAWRLRECGKSFLRVHKKRLSKPSGVPLVA